MSLRALELAAFASFTLAVCLPASAQQPGKLPHIGYLSPGAGYPFDSFREGLRDLGYAFVDPADAVPSLQNAHQ